MSNFSKRIDLDIYNEACAFSVADAAALNKIIDDENFDAFHENPENMFHSAKVIAVELLQDDPFNARIMIGGNLNEEEMEWVGKITGNLIITGDELLVSGGYDSDAFAEYFHEQGKSEFVNGISLDSGTYRVDIYTYLNSINGEACFAQDEKDEAVVKWFRKEHPEQPYPRWMEWMLDTENVEIDLEEDKRQYIDFLIHLTLNDGNTKLSKISSDGFFEPGTGKRTLHSFPSGVRSNSLEPYEEWTDEREETIFDLFNFDQSSAVAIQNCQVGMTAHPLKGGSLSCNVKDIVYLWYLGWFCDQYADIAVIAHVADGKWLYEEVRDKFMDREQKKFTAVLTRASIWICERAMQKIVDFLDNIPDGSTLELVSASTGAGSAGNQLYRGVIENNKWHISHTSPVLDTEQFIAAREMCLEIGKERPVHALDDDEAQYVKDMARKSEWLAPGGIELIVNDYEIDIEQAYKAPLMLLFFRNRFRGIWDVEESEVFEEQEHSEWQEDSDSILGELDNSFFDMESSQEKLYHGKYSNYSQADIANVVQSKSRDFFNDLSGIFKLNEAASTAVELVTQIDREMAALGFNCLGDVVCDDLGEVVMRAYGNTAKCCYGSFMAGMFTQAGIDFYTSFTDGISQTTTNNEGMTVPPDSAPENGIFRLCEPESAIEDLYKLHEEMVAALLSDSRAVTAVQEDLKSYAKAMDDYFKRFFQG